MTPSEQLGNNNRDLQASLTAGIVGAIPFAGSLLAELVKYTIPNQRIDRLSKYVEKLDERLSKIPIEKINALFENESFIDLIEEGFVQASRAISDERREYIANIVSNGLKDGVLELQESKYLLKMIQELNDIEIVWLRSYLYGAWGNRDKDFKRKHLNIITPVHLYMGSDSELQNKAALQKSYTDHLERLKLIERKVKFDNKKQLPKFDRKGKPETDSPDITVLGKLLLKQIGLIEEK